MQGKNKERTQTIGLRVTPEESKEIRKLAAAAGLSLTAYLIGCALGTKAADYVLKNK